mgnify:CR=1 FL=1
MSAIASETRKQMLMDEIASAGPQALALFESSLKQGSSLEFAAMCALRQAPGSRNTDRAFCQGARRQMDSMSEVNQKKLYEIAKKAGISTQGKFYKGSLGRYTDPAAWVSCAEDVLTVCKERNLHCEGVISHKAVDLPPVVNKIKLGPDIVNGFVKEELKKDGPLREKARKHPQSTKEVVERVVETHARK